MRKIIVALLIIVQCSLKAQTNELLLFTQFKDTLVLGLQNRIEIKPAQGIQNITLVGDKILVSKTSETVYSVVVQPGNLQRNLKISYKYKKQQKEMNLHFTVVSLTPALTNRILISQGLPPVAAEKEKPLALEKKADINLVIPKSMPNFFWPLAVSENKKYAYIGNLENHFEGVMDLKSRKLSVSGKMDSIVATHYESDFSFKISNTGRYLFGGFDGTLNDRYILFRDLISKTYLYHDFPLYSKFQELRMNGFSPNDLVFSCTAATEEREMLVIASISDASYKEYNVQGNKINCSSFINDSSIIVISQNYNESKSVKIPVIKPQQFSERIYIQEMDVRTGKINYTDSLLVPAYRGDFKIEHTLLYISYLDIDADETFYILYDLKTRTIIDRIKKTIKFSNRFKNAPTFISTDPKCNMLIVGKMGRNDSEFFYYDLINHALFNSPLRYYNSRMAFYPPVLIENEIAFGAYQPGTTYLDEPTDRLFWYDPNTGDFEAFSAEPLMEVDTWINSNDGACSDSSAFLKTISIDYTVMKEKGGEKKEAAEILVSPLNLTTIRFGTYQPSGIYNYALYDGMYEADLARLSIRKIHSYPRFTNKTSSKAFTWGDYNCSNKETHELDSLIQKELAGELFLLDVKQKNKFIYKTKQQNSMVFYNSLMKNPASRVVKLVLFKSGEWMYYSDDMYYACNFNGTPFFQYTIDGKLFPFEQFDLKYNRPDIILERLGYSDTNTIVSYHNAYAKRLKRLGFTEDMLKEDVLLPEIRISNFETLPAVIETPVLDLDLEMKDGKYKLDRINIYINDVPLYGSAGIDLRNEAGNTLKKRLKIELVQGQNKIQVSVLNQAGAESYKQTVYVKYKPVKEIKPDLYLITIGTSNHLDSRYNLTYAAKDAKDIQSLYKQNKIFAKVFSHELTDNNVTKENLLGLKNVFKNAKREDIVIVTVAGHGVLDKNLEYFLATYDMDFNNPASKGLLYEELEGILDGITPLKKVVLIDACHSGEVDKEEVEQLAQANLNSGDVKFRTAGAGIQKKSLGLKSTSELMSELFTDLRRGTGATVISSAGGVEYAMESDQWKNGLFTYCLLHGLKDKAADANNDGQIMLSELQQYLRTEVTRLSNGAQQPTSRIENLSMDFRIW
ncbi:MAG TPA: caspase family protein [Flavobacteriales bacterium]|nr:caspase family protein [Flavobacteriales bacterium]